MAKVVMPLLSGQVRGKIGDIVFFKRYGKQLARMRVYPTNPKTEKQVVVRTNLSGLSKMWKGEDAVLKKYNSSTGSYDTITATALTAAEKGAWETHATSLGKPKIYGRLLFIGVNIHRLLTGYDVKRTP
jgi:hypothetical protein